MRQMWGNIRTERRSAALVLAIVVALPFVLSFNPYYVSIFIPAVVLGGAALSWNLLAGMCGQVSFGHAAFFGIGAYTSAVLVVNSGWDPFPAMAAAGLCGALCSLIFGLPAFRLRGPYFALAILGCAEVMKLLSLNLTWLNEGSRGIFNIPPLSPIHLGSVTLGAPG